MIEFDESAIRNLRDSGGYDQLQTLFDHKIAEVRSGEDLATYLSYYLGFLAHYKQLGRMSAEQYLDVLGGFVESPAALRELSSQENLTWPDVTKILIYSIDRD